MKFYMTPGSCSTGIHILLKEIGLFFEAYILNLPRGDHLKPDYLAINPNGAIPTLVLDDGTALTDFVSIATWLARTYPRRADKTGIALPPNCAAHYQRMKARPAVRQVLAEEGYR